MDNTKKLLGQRIKELRKKKNYTQEQLAEILEIDQRTLSAIECGTNFPTKNFVKLTKVFGVTLSELFNFEHLELSIEQKKAKICELLNELDVKEIDIIYKLAKSMV